LLREPRPQRFVQRKISRNHGSGNELTSIHVAFDTVAGLRSGALFGDKTPASAACSQRIICD
jgi:hypothetical protein